MTIKLVSKCLKCTANRLGRAENFRRWIKHRRPMTHVRWFMPLLYKSRRHCGYVRCLMPYGSQTSALIHVPKCRSMANLTVSLIRLRYLVTKILRRCKRTIGYSPIRHGPELHHIRELSNDLIITTPFPVKLTITRAKLVNIIRRTIWLPLRNRTTHPR